MVKIKELLAKNKPIIALAPMADYTDSPFCCVCRMVARGVMGNRWIFRKGGCETPPSLPLNEGEESAFAKATARQARDWIPAFAGMTIGKLETPSNLPLNKGEENCEEFVVFREMVSAEALVRGNEKTLKMCEFEKIERPIVLQIFGSKPSQIAKAVEIVVDKFKPDGIDINMGCPVPKIAGKSDSGAALMKDHERAIKIVKEVKAILPKEITLSVKTRLGWSNPEDILEFAPKLEKAGVDFITVHGRTKMQGYSGKANWEMISRVKKIISIPLIVNGDVNSKEDISECLKITGADGVMIGRGALGNPWIFMKGGFKTPSNLPLNEGEGDCEVSMKERVETVLGHARLHLERYGEKSMVTFRKHLLQYFKGNLGIENSKNLRVRLAQVKDIKELEEVLSSLI